MKTLTILTVVFLFTGCASQKPRQMTAREIMATEFADDKYMTDTSHFRVSDSAFESRMLNFLKGTTR